MFVVALPGHIRGRNRGFDRGHVVSGKLHLERAERLSELRPGSCADDRDDARVSGEHPRDGEPQAFDYDIGRGLLESEEQNRQLHNSGRPGATTYLVNIHAVFHQTIPESGDILPLPHPAGRQFPSAFRRRVEPLLRNLEARQRPSASHLAFNDPNDLLTFPLPAGWRERLARDSIGQHGERIDVINVFLTNAPYRWFGVVVNPARAHTGYWTNDLLVKLLVEGYAARPTS